MDINDCIISLLQLDCTIGYLDSSSSNDIEFISNEITSVVNALESIQEIQDKEIQDKEIQDKEIQDKEIYFVFDRFVFNDGNNCDIDKNLVGCFKKYNSAKDCLNEFFDDLHTNFPKEKLNRELNTSSGEIEGYGYWIGSALCEVSIFKCIPH